MCGIVGALVFEGSAFTVTNSYIDTMRDTMVHRGPDGAGTWIGKNGRIGLGHRRLSIIDLSSAAAQPMSNEDGSILITFNGEIYNHAEIRAELERLGGHRFKTDHSDTEMIVHAYEQWGYDCLERFRGMFAFAIWDGNKKELWLVRDRIGIKPLYYSIHHGRIVFASEIKALLKDPDQKREVNEESFYYYLTYLTSPPPNTLFAGIKKLTGGSWLRVRSDGSIEERRYWEMFDNVVPAVHSTDDDIAANLLDELRVAVKLRKVSDVPVGVFLSGGIDSSTNAVLFSEGESRPIKTFTIGYQGEYQSYRNENHYAKLIARKVGAEYHERMLSIDDLIDFLPRMIELQDEPIADPVCVPVYYVSKLARDNGVIVCQVGEGADELFWGYAGWKFSYLLQTMINAMPFRSQTAGAAGKLLRAVGKNHNGYSALLDQTAKKQPIFWGGAIAFNDDQKTRLLSDRLQQKFRDCSAWDGIEPIYKRYIDNVWEPSVLHWMSYLDLNFRLPELLLMRVDKMSMGVSLEGRVPFLDHRLVELAMGIPDKVKTRNFQQKYILKKAVRGVIPDVLIDRRKQGFGVPVYEWFFDKLGKKIKNELRFCCQHSDFLHWPTIENMLAQGQGVPVWYLFNFALWWRQYIAGETP